MSGLQRLIVLAPLALLFGLVAIFALQLDDDPSILPSALIGQPVPAFDLPVLQQDARATDSLFKTGTPKLINVFASWCQPCRIEHSLVSDLAAEGVEIVGWGYKDTPAGITRFLAELGNPYSHVVLDESGQTAIDLGVYGAPETYVVDAEGIIRYRHVGVLTQEVIDRDLRPLLQSLAEA
ncbi:MAG: DsbE family thiol:disulfide interchange protein [Pseudomonadota bacterium]